ncbi:4-(cytidine 5'-diphospho)-2-C-methyl-D-erythritol kinase [Campylobacter sp. RM9344]|uniref:4-diphosphocytidyl-2-C-methyl-D-erythritol kinase n=1 Tax=Campylobacter californiensis TaxID=1032243 RepID=A0AAW3ZRD7_9BACT|nr:MULTISPECIES: 4-(cytidine 5'-diphospho)-2-C-methyl-D-erythritol kinase [unclassified Campylobacter]MBE2983952.1 4-(cytidine 5'-diphospho)-2-C-methyl-D-erythritol kinase [Campylobacter sp. RM6883]MBE2986114.1 4-(cytidine 5'-diphospho)-2-C-methyl-D-erythritol kinase [Campylobacter sp. RM12919]MBE2987527.1 4-(cytidine 5'-diphospho)-2-C-methyl-D-erythritol kinase [Campylobacter sp. RM12920]MBE2994490.1 4-(cytidine 5'-diphospho)-2-C-methyl-D-erythritol kinase [Campylobacter sp. RM6913]MBE3022484
MKSYAKINIFLKIVGTRGNYHEILSRFARFEDIFDEIEFQKADKFELTSNVDIKDNIILKAKTELENAGFKDVINEFFTAHKIVLNKNIPTGAGLGGGSSNAATFLLMTNEQLNLKIPMNKLAQIGAKIGSDVPFFIYGYKSANVSGVGEIVKEFDDDVPQTRLITPNVFCSTPQVYKKFRSDFMQNINVKQANDFLNLSSSKLLQNFKNYELNDLYAPCLELYPQLKEHEDQFLSGSGSSFFMLKSQDSK